MKIAMDISYTGKMQASTWQGDSKDFANTSKLFELAKGLGRDMERLGKKIVD